jgi:hypothetical protein
MAGSARLCWTSYSSTSSDGPTDPSGLLDASYEQHSSFSSIVTGDDDDRTITDLLSSSAQFSDMPLKRIADRTVSFKPSILLIETAFETDARSEIQIAPGERGIGVGVAHIAFLIRLALNGDRLARHPSD